MIAILFFFVILYWTFLEQKDEYNTQRYNLIVTILFILLMGLRNEAIYGDTYSYVHNFLKLDSMSIQGIIARWPKDTFFYIVTHYLNPILFHNYTLWLLLIAFIYMVPLSCIVKRYSKNPMLSWVCFIFLGLMMFVMAGLRQTVAFGIVLAGFLFLLQSKSKYFFASIFLAYFFHGTSLVFVLAYPLSKIRFQFSRKTILFYILAITLIMVLGTTILTTITDVLGQNDERYISYGTKLHGSTYTYMLQQAILVVPSLYYLRKYFEDSIFAVFAHMSLIGLVFVSLSPVIAEMFRVSMYFSWANMILFPLAMTEASKTDNMIQKVFMCIFIVYLVFINKTVTTDYYFFFENTPSITKTF